LESIELAPKQLKAEQSCELYPTLQEQLLFPTQFPFPEQVEAFKALNPKQTETVLVWHWVPSYPLIHLQLFKFSQVPLFEQTVVSVLFIPKQVKSSQFEPKNPASHWH
jgi:hypothetical protein